MTYKLELPDITKDKIFIEKVMVMEECERMHRIDEKDEGCDGCKIRNVCEKEWDDRIERMELKELKIKMARRSKVNGACEGDFLQASIIL